MATRLDLEATRGDTWYWEFTVLQDDGETPQDITGALVRFTAKQQVTDSDGAAPIVGSTGGGQCQVIDAAAGQLTVKIPPAQTALLDAPISLHYDLQLQDGAGNIYTVSKGRIRVTADISLTAP